MVTFVIYQFCYNMAPTAWALKHVSFVNVYKVLTMHGEEKQRSLGF